MFASSDDWQNLPGLFAAFSTLALLCGCTPPESSPLVFTQGVTVGINVGSSATNPSVPELAVGLKQANAAVVPTVIPKDVPLGFKDNRRIAGHGGQISSNLPGASEPLEGLEDALSTFGSFSGQTQVNEVNLGVFFATGVAAQNLADGFRCAASDNAAHGCASIE